MPDIYKSAANVVDPARLAFLRWLAEGQSQRHTAYGTYREYYDGDHATQLTERMRRFLQVKTGEEFSTNYCPIVVDALVERLTVTGFDAGDQAEVFTDWWKKNRMDAKQGIVHRSAVRDGDTYLMVEWDAGENRPRFVHELAYDGTNGVEMKYSDENGSPLYACKRWRVESGPDAGYVTRLNVYYPGRVEKYVSHARDFEGNWQPFQEEGESWPLYLTRDGTEYGEPLGIPIIHFRNADQGYDYGQSELRNVLPLQNGLNKALIDLIAVMDASGFPIHYMLGDDPSGLDVAPGSWIYSQRPPGGEQGVAVGTLEGVDPDKLIRAKDAMAMEIARVTRTPLSYFQVTGQIAAEGTLKQQESGLVARATNRQVTFGNSWEDAMALARRLWNTYGSGPELDEEQTIDALWAPAETRNEKEHIETVAVKLEKLQISRRRAWQEAGYDDATIQQMEEELQQEQSQERASLGQAMLRAQRDFDQGQGGEPMEDMGEAPGMGGMQEMTAMMQKMMAMMGMQGASGEHGAGGEHGE